MELPNLTCKFFTILIKFCIFNYFVIKNLIYSRDEIDIKLINF